MGADKQLVPSLGGRAEQVLLDPSSSFSSLPSPFPLPESRASVARASTFYGEARYVLLLFLKCNSPVFKCFRSDFHGALAGQTQYTRPGAAPRTAACSPWEWLSLSQGQAPPEWGAFLCPGHLVLSWHIGHLMAAAPCLHLC